jgi:hypothetical protein
MRRLTAILFAGLLALASLVALSCGGGDKSDVAAPPTATAKSVATAGKTPASKRATSTPIPRGPVGVNTTAEATADDSGDEPTRNSTLLQLCLGVNDEKWRQVCAAVASKDVSKCSDMPVSAANGKVGWQALCGFLVAAATGNAAICDNVQAIAPGYDPAIMDLGEWGADCYMYVAIGSKNVSLCEKTTSPDGCEQAVAVAKGGVPLDHCDSLDCLFGYALRNGSSEACDKLATTAGALGETMKTSCLAMLSGNEADCDPLKSVGVNEWSGCVSRALYGQARPAPGGFEFSVCGDDTGCLSRAIEDMAYFIGGGKDE